ncbi:MAG: ABC transporter ATP-binding protein [Capnocytophaga sp.]|nr:ABC transporter ATP-binding protein [Capnocytophaga sp.]
MQNPLVQIRDLRVTFGRNEVVHGLSFDIFPNEIIGIVGESGSGKSVTSLALMGLLPSSASVRGTVVFDTFDLLSQTSKQWRKLRGNDIAMIFQEPMSSLNPSMRCGVQVAEILGVHTQMPKSEIKKEVLSLFEKVKLPNPQRIFESYPHQLSGGQKQRVMIAMAIACKPKLLIADEPTTALDVSVQNEILSLLKELQKETAMSILFISHDLGVVSQIAHRVLVMYRGDLVEQGSSERVFRHPEQLYTQALLASKPSTKIRLKRLPTIDDFVGNKVAAEAETTKQRIVKHARIYTKEPLLHVKNVTKTYVSSSGLLAKNQSFKAIDTVSLTLYEGETLGLVGESGCGKTTLGKMIAKLTGTDSGQIFYKGKDITHLNRSETKQLRKDIQIIFQDPYSSLNPKMKVGEAVTEPMTVHGMYANAAERKAKTLEIFEKVGLSPEHFDRYPHEFSGGQRQRIGIARAIALQPKIIICDESVSALDISVQAQVLNLLNELKDNYGFSYIFISHDLSVVKYMSDRIAVMQKGNIEEIAEADDLYRHPKSGYTRSLIAVFDQLNNVRSV